MSDLISRAETIKAVEDLPNAYNGWSDAYDKACIIGVIEEVPSAEYSKPLQTTLNGDLISKADAIKGIRKCKFESDMPSDWYKGMEAAQSIIKALPSADAEPKKWGCTANFVAEQLDKLEDMTVSEKLKLIQDLLGVELKEENLNYEHATLVDIKEPLKVEVVRCKDCKHLKTMCEDEGTCYYWCKHWNNATDDWGHCYYGERREP